MASHSHEFHELIIVLSGCLHVRIQGNLLEGLAGDVLWYPRGVLHEEWADPSSPVESLYLGFHGHMGSGALPPRLADAQGRVGFLARWLYADRETNPSTPSPAANAFLRAILAELRRLATHVPHPLVSRVRAYMRKRLANHLCLDDLAACAGLSRFHFVRRYRALAGRTPMADLRQVRLLAARDLLLTTTLPLKEIAPRTGLGDAYHLSHAFRQTFQMPPGRLRR